jgi:hypothetical protein
MVLAKGSNKVFGVGTQRSSLLRGLLGGCDAHAGGETSVGT